MKKFIPVLAILVLFLSACSNETVGGLSSPVEITEPVEITFWHAMSGAQEEALITLTDEYNASQDNVSVILENQGDYSTLEDKLSQSGQSGDLPTMAMGYSNWMYEYISQDLLVNLQNFYDDSEYGVDSSSYVPAFMDEVSFDGSLYGVPFNKSTEVLFYNKELVEEAGITKYPKSIDELLTDANLITEKTGTVGVGYDSLSNYLAISIKECGIDTWFNDNGESQFNDTCVTDRVQLYQDAINSGSFRVAGEDGYLSGPFGNGDLAMNIGSTAGAPFIESSVDGKFEYGVAPYPGEVVSQQGTNLMIFNTATEQEVSGAWDYIKFLTTDANTTKWAIATGYLPVTNAAYESEDYQKYMETNETASISYQQIENMEVVVPIFGGSNEIYNTSFNDFMSSVLEADGNVVDEMNALDESATSIYQRNN